MKIPFKRFRVQPREQVDLRQRPTIVEPFYAVKDDYRRVLAGQIEQLSKLQQLLYAQDQHAVLVILQGMDAAGKDGVIRHVMSGINPQGCQVFSFKQPSPIELEHDFLWRTTCRLPERGRIGIFNRSYYEEVLIVRVHPEILQGQRLGIVAGNPGKKLWHERYRSIVDFEQHLHANGTRIVKIFLHLSKEEQRLRFLARIDAPDRNWKLSPADIAERKFWKEYRHAYAAALSATSSQDAPWFVVPADDKYNARLIVAQILVDTLGDLGLSYPAVTPAQAEQLQMIRAALE